MKINIERNVFHSKYKLYAWITAAVSKFYLNPTFLFVCMFRTSYHIIIICLVIRYKLYLTFSKQCSKLEDILYIFMCENVYVVCAKIVLKDFSVCEFVSF